MIRVLSGSEAVEYKQRLFAREANFEVFLWFLGGRFKICGEKMSNKEKNISNFSYLTKLTMRIKEFSLCHTKNEEALFSGIVEAIAKVIETQATKELCRILVERPESFDDINSGDSIAINGVCLTVENFNDKTMGFCIGKETLGITGWTEEFLKNTPLNLERSLRMGDRIHGHFVTGHVDEMGEITQLQKSENWLIKIAIKNFDRRLVWKKGSIGINGVSLTINEVDNEAVSVCLIPETVKRTNFQYLNVGDEITIEYDTWAKAFVNYQQHKGKS